MDILNNYFWEIPKLVKIQKKKNKSKKRKRRKSKGTSVFILLCNFYIKYILSDVL